MQGWGHAVADFTRLEGAVAEPDRLGAEGWEAAGLVSTWGAGWCFVHPVVPAEAPAPRVRATGGL